ncbi:MAG: hypothetical protein LBM98_04215 [Oscillospiraceae bacterium]|nr:hypothetical protein [Oscillospiraceae bacterium]
MRPAGEPPRRLRRHPSQEGNLRGHPPPLRRHPPLKRGALEGLDEGCGVRRVTECVPPTSYVLRPGAPSLRAARSNPSPVPPSKSPVQTCVQRPGAVRRLCERRQT